MVILYVIVGLELIWFTLNDIESMTILLIIFLLAALVLRILHFKPPKPQWGDIKSILARLFQFTDENVQGSEIITSNDTSIRAKSAIFNANFTDQLREIGLDSVLICLFLMRNPIDQRNPSTITTALNIPRSTLYRNIQRLIDLELVSENNLLSDGRRKTYQITYTGELLLEDLNSMLSI